MLVTVRIPALCSRGIKKCGMGQCAVICIASGCWYGSTSTSYYACACDRALLLLVLLSQDGWEDVCQLNRVL